MCLTAHSLARRPTVPDWLLYVLISVAMIVFVIACVVGAFVFDEKLGLFNEGSELRDGYAETTEQHARIAQQLDELDVRAHSLSSPAVDAELRSWWETCRTAFLRADTVIRDSGLTSSSSRRTLREHAAEVREAEAASRTMRDAADVIDRILAVERGDAMERHDSFTYLIGDINEAEADHYMSDTAYPRLQELESRVRDLRETAATHDGPEILTGYADLVRDFDDVRTAAEREKAAVVAT
jgi:hypothetical protein